MPIVSGLERRGAVYYWRRRLPKPLAGRLSAALIKICLRTKEVRVARFLSAQLDAAAERLFMLPPPANLSREQLPAIFKETFEAHRAKLAQLDNHVRRDGDADLKTIRAEHRATGYAYRLLARLAKAPRSIRTTTIGSPNRG
ncbi:MAG: hypothetical protein HC909_00380 [Blastochloris sp.]|nr:hypothetical protein [Blastochloris sp.]